MECELHKAEEFCVVQLHSKKKVLRLSKKTL